MLEGERESAQNGTQGKDWRQSWKCRSPGGEVEMLVAGKSWKNGGGWFRQRPASASERQRASALRPHSDHRPQRNPVNPGSQPTGRIGRGPFDAQFLFVDSGRRLSTAVQLLRAVLNGCIQRVQG